MILYSLQEICLMIAAAIVIDWIIGDPKYPTHPVIYIGRLTKALEARLYNKSRTYSERSLLARGALLTAAVLLLSGALMLAIVCFSDWLHPWLGYAVSTWFISTTIAVKGLKDAAMLVYYPLSVGDLAQARTYIGYIVSRDQEVMGEPEITRAAVETVSENIVDAFISPLFWALIGGAPMAMGYRAANTLDSMVGYRNERYEYFGKCSARLDDVLNYIPARVTGWLIVAVAFVLPFCSARQAAAAIARFASKHPSPNSGIPEAAVAGALGVQLGGRNRYFGKWEARAVMGWEREKLTAKHIKKSVIILYSVSILIWLGVMLAWLTSSVIK